jgi:hypothetical protein
VTADNENPGESVDREQRLFEHAVARELAGEGDVDDVQRGEGCDWRKAAR